MFKSDSSPPVKIHKQGQQEGQVGRRERHNVGIINKHVGPSCPILVQITAKSRSIDPNRAF